MVSDGHCRPHSRREASKCCAEPWVPGPWRSSSALRCSWHVRTGTTATSARQAARPPPAAAEGKRAAAPPVLRRPTATHPAPIRSTLQGQAKRWIRALRSPDPTRRCPRRSGRPRAARVAAPALRVPVAATPTATIAAKEQRTTNAGTGRFVRTARRRVLRAKANLACEPSENRESDPPQSFSVFMAPRGVTLRCLCERRRPEHRSHRLLLHVEYELGFRQHQLGG